MTEQIATLGFIVVEVVLPVVFDAAVFGLGAEHVHGEAVNSLTDTFVVFLRRSEQPERAHHLIEQTRSSRVHRHR